MAFNSIHAEPLSAASATISNTKATHIGAPNVLPNHCPPTQMTAAANIKKDAFITKILHLQIKIGDHITNNVRFQVIKLITLIIIRMGFL